LNYIGAEDRETMLAEQTKADAALQAVCAREGFSVRHLPDEHAGGKWQLRYYSAFGQSGSLEIDLNFMYRVPLWPVQEMDSREIGIYQGKKINVLDIHELAAGKLAALLSRGQSRDLFDAHELLTSGLLEKNLLRTSFVVYGGLNRKDWRTVSAKDLEFDPKEFSGRLIPLLRDPGSLALGHPVEYGQRLIEECREALSMVLPLKENERRFLDVLLERGEINPALITSDHELQERIKRHPALRWKALNVRKHFGIGNE